MTGSTYLPSQLITQVTFGNGVMTYECSWASIPHCFVFSPSNEEAVNYLPEWERVPFFMPPKLHECSPSIMQHLTVTFVYFYCRLESRTTTQPHKFCACTSVYQCRCKVKEKKCKPVCRGRDSTLNWRLTFCTCPNSLELIGAITIIIIIMTPMVWADHL